MLNNVDQLCQNKSKKLFPDDVLNIGVRWTMMNFFTFCSSSHRRREGIPGQSCRQQYKQASYHTSYPQTKGGSFFIGLDEYACKWDTINRNENSHFFGFCFYVNFSRIPNDMKHDRSLFIKGHLLVVEFFVFAILLSRPTFNNPYTQAVNDCWARQCRSEQRAIVCLNWCKSNFSRNCPSERCIDHQPVCNNSRSSKWTPGKRSTNESFNSSCSSLSNNKGGYDIVHYL